MDVYIWLLCRKSMGKSDLKRIGNYVIGNRKERQAFDKFRDSPFYQGRPMLRTHLLSEFMNKRQVVPKSILKHGLEFITNFPTTLLDDLCNWTRGILYKKNDATNLTSSNSSIKILYVIYISYICFTADGFKELLQDKPTDLKCGNIGSYILYIISAQALQYNILGINKTDEVNKGTHVTCSYSINYIHI